MKDVIGLRCNTSIDPCQLLKPCKSKRFCQRIDSYPGYTCVCPDGLTEKQCDHEDEICPPNFCRNGNENSQRNKNIENSVFRNLSKDKRIEIHLSMWSRLDRHLL